MPLAFLWIVLYGLAIAAVLDQCSAPMPQYDWTLLVLTAVLLSGTSS
jgi:hypothetical protein